MPEGHVLEFSGITKRYGAVTAVDNFTARIEPGIVTGFLGPNGAGKTTTLRMLLGLVNPTAGTATIDGRPYAELRHPAQTVGAVLEATSFHPGRTAAGHLKVYAQAAGIPTTRVGEVLEMVGLADAARRKVGGFSLGMRQRLALATALLGDPAVLVLDEPTNGLDPEGIQWIRIFLRALAAEGRTVLVSSHMLSEVQQTVDSLVIISQGRRVFQGDFTDLLADADQSVTVDGPDRDALGAALHTAGLPATLLRSGFTVRGVEAAAVGAAASAAGVTLSALARRGPSLEDVFFELVNGERVHASAQVSADAAARASADTAFGADAALAASAAVVAPLAATAPAADASPETMAPPVTTASPATTASPVTTAENDVIALLTPDGTDAIPLVDGSALFGAPAEAEPAEQTADDAAEETADVSDDTVAISLDDIPGVAAGDAVAAMRASGQNIQLPLDGPVPAAAGLVVAAAAVGGPETDAAEQDASAQDAADGATDVADADADAAVETSTDADDQPALADLSTAEQTEDEAPVRLSSGERPWWEPADIAVPSGTVSTVTEPGTIDVPEAADGDISDADVVDVVTSERPAVTGEPVESVAAVAEAVADGAEAVADGAEPADASAETAPPAWWLPSPVNYTLGEQEAPTADVSEPDAATAVLATPVTDLPPLFRAPAVTGETHIPSDEMWAPPRNGDDQPSIFEVAATGEIAIIRTGAIPVITPEVAEAAQFDANTAADAPAAEPSFDDLLAAPDTAPAGDELLQPHDDDNTASDDTATAFFDRFGGPGNAPTEGGAR